MTVDLTQAIANTREMMDAASSQRWDDAFITTVLGIVHWREWSGLLGASPYYRFATRTVTTAQDGTFALSQLDSGSGDSTQTHYRIMAITDGYTVYRESGFIQLPLATTTNYDTPYQRLWYPAGANIQCLPVTGNLSLTVTVNYRPQRADLLSSPSVAIDFPDSHEVILWLEAAAQLLSKGGAEVATTQTMKALAAVERNTLYQDLSRFSARPDFLTYPDGAAEWAGSGIW